MDTNKNDGGRMVYSVGQKKKGSLPGRVLLCIAAFLFCLLFLLYGACAVICWGPSHAARDLFVNTMMETSAMKFLPRMYFSKEKVEAILASTAARQTDEITDGSGVVVGGGDEAFDLSALTVEDVQGNTFVGKLMTVNDPARIIVDSVSHYSVEGYGEKLTVMMNRNNAVAGINGGGFLDPGGMGKGGMPLGVVIQRGELRVNNGGAVTVIGFTNEHKLVVGQMSGSEALEMGIVEAVSFGPALIINGERVPVAGSGYGAGLNPRTAIGQRADGAVLLLVIDGRQPHSLGASYIDLADIMLEHGAVNAANLDGGSSSMMFLNGEMLNTLSMIGERLIPTCFLVLPEGGAAQ